MKRTNLVFAALLPITASFGLGQEPAKPAPTPAQADSIDDIVASIRAAELRATSFRLEVSTSGRLPGGLEVSTKGTLHVLRGTQPAMHSAVDYAFADGLTGRMESAQTGTGIVIF